MAAACEISNVFSTYFSTMYSPEDPTPTTSTAASGSEDPVLSPDSPQVPLEGAEKSSWLEEQPQFWSKAQVLDWVSYQVEKNKFDASTIDFSRCDMDGAALCSCDPEELRTVFGPLGDQLYSQLWELTPNFPDELSWIIDLLEKDGMSFQETLGDPGSSREPPALPAAGESAGPGTSGGLTVLQSLCESSPDLVDQGGPFGQGTMDEGPQGTLSPGSSDVSTTGTGTSRSSQSSDCGGSDVDLDPTDSKLFCREGRADKEDAKHGKRKRGRPRKLSTDSPEGLDSKRSKHAPRGTHLWEFIRDILMNPELNEGLLRWEDRREGVFKFLRSEAVAQLWGQKKKNSSMTYEKLSRAMRYYYKREILERVDGRRLVYKFGKNSSGWREEEVAQGQH